MTTPAKQAIEAELDAARAEFHALLQSFGEQDLGRQSKNLRWTNGEVLFHAAFAFMLLPWLIGIVRVSRRLPARYSGAFAKALNFSTPAFNLVNWLGPRIGGRVFNGPRLSGLYDRTHRRILRRLRRLSEEELRSGMPYPSRWDPLFDDYMTIEQLVAYPIAHFRFHVGQLSR